jgi:hypothetical protein
MVEPICSSGKRAPGRPSRVVELITQDRPVNVTLPPARNEIPREISARHQSFARQAAWECVPRGIKALGFRGIVAAYVKTYNPRSYAGTPARGRRNRQDAGPRTRRRYTMANPDRSIIPMPTGHKRRHWFPNSVQGYRLCHSPCVRRQQTHDQPGIVCLDWQTISHRRRDFNGFLSPSRSKFGGRYKPRQRI